MDPNEALSTARGAVKAIRAAPNLVVVEDEAETLADAFAALDEWLTKGGFLPNGWHLPWMVPSATDRETDERLVFSIEQLVLRVLRDAEHEGWRSVDPALARRIGLAMAEESRRTREMLIKMADSAVTKQFLTEAAQRLALEGMEPKAWVIDPDDGTMRRVDR